MARPTHGGDNSIHPLLGDDLVFGGSGNDQTFGDTGNDTLTIYDVPDLCSYTHSDTNILYTSGDPRSGTVQFLDAIDAGRRFCC